MIENSLITHRQRLEACLAGEPLDRVPVALWRHFPVDDQRPESLAAATLAFHKTFDFDLVKVTPSSSFCLQDWGIQDEWRGATEGTRDYAPPVIQQPEDWGRLEVLDPYAGKLGDQLVCLRLLAEQLSPATPIIQTVFNPLSQAKNLVGKANLQAHLRQYPEAVHAGLQVITETTRRFVEAVRTTGIDGIFYAIQHAQYSLLSEAEYATFGRQYDLQVLEPAQAMWLNMLHLHGSDVMFDFVADYPVQILNWHDRDTFPSLEEGQKRFKGVVCGGLQREASMVLGNPVRVTAEARDAIQATGGQRFILGTGCVVPITAPYGNLMAARMSVQLGTRS
jgi:uroporphyrinogen decarboxylase